MNVYMVSVLLQSVIPRRKYQYNINQKLLSSLVLSLDMLVHMHLTSMHAHEK